MSSRPRIFSFAALSALMVASILASSAAASNFHSEISTTFLFGEQSTTNVLTTAGGTVKCKKASFEGTSTGTSVSEIFLTPSYSECTAFGQAATVTTNGCRFELESFGDVDIGCPLEHAIVINVPKGNCSLQITLDLSVGTADYTNEGTGSTRDVLVTWTGTGIDYFVSGLGTICGTGGTHTDGKYTGTFTLKGFTNVAHTTQAGIWVE